MSAVEARVVLTNEGAPVPSVAVTFHITTEFRRGEWEAEGEAFGSMLCAYDNCHNGAVGRWIAKALALT